MVEFDDSNSNPVMDYDHGNHRSMPPGRGLESRAPFHMRRERLVGLRTRANLQMIAHLVNLFERGDPHPDLPGHPVLVRDRYNSVSGLW